MHRAHEILFEPVRIGPVTSRNRFYQVPHGPGAGNLLDIDKGIKGVRAEGGWGVVCAEICSIHPSSDDNYAGIRRLWNDQHVQENAITVDEIHRYGALAGIELAHLGLAAFNYATKVPIWGPTRQAALHSTEAFSYQAEAMNREAIRSLLTWQRQAANRAAAAGFDIVYVYAAHNLSLAQHFLSPRFNRRTDEYGGTIENRARLLRQMIEVTKDAVGTRCAVAVRMSVDALSGLDDITADREGRQVVEMLGELPDLWDVNVSDWANDSRSSRFGKEGWQEQYVSFVKKCTTKPVVGVGRFTSPDTMASQIRRGILDLIGAARPSIADPFLPQKIYEGRTEEIRECIGCNYCVKTVNHGVVAGCTQNPTMGEEWRRGWHPERIPPATSTSRILVVGAGAAGLEATRALAQRGYQVTLAEATGELGGRVRRESALPGLSEWRRVADWRVRQLSRSPSATVYKCNHLTAEDILGLEHKHIVIATGSRWVRTGVGIKNCLPIQLDVGAHVYTADDVMEGRFPETGPVVVFDDDHYYMGAVVAERLRERGLEVEFVTPGHTVSKHTEASLESRCVLERMRQLALKLNVHSNIVRIARDHVTLADLLSDEQTSIEAAAVVLVTSREPVDGLYQDLVSDPERLLANDIRTVHALGDARVPGTIAAAVFDGHRYAREFDEDVAEAAILPPSSRTLY